MANTDMRFKGRVAVVTGASAGIGRAIAEALLAHGASVIAVSRRPPVFSHDRLTSYSTDLSQPEAVRETASRIAKEHEADILINNAGVVRNTFLENVEDAEFNELVDLHLRSAVILAQTVLPSMKRKSFGRIVNMSSRAVVGLAGRTVYAATKAALISMTRTWALELGPFGITVNAIAPGPVVTDMLTGDFPEKSEKAKKLAASIPVRRLGRSADIARAAMYFADPENGWVTGQTLFVCGGASLGSTVAL
jgi:NAD(P)-dependent dehydrogenase (short-subunit alcohol dehydrogenase family)